MESGLRAFVVVERGGSEPDRLIGLTSGASTLVGPLPYDTVGAAAEVVCGVERSLVGVPLLAAVDPREALPHWGLLGIEGVLVRPEGGIDVDVARVVGEPAVGLGPAPAVPVAFESVVERAPSRLVRLPVVGPVTVAMTLRLRGIESATAAVVATAAARVRVDAAVAAAHEAGVVPLVALLEPGLVGSAHPTFPYDRAAVTAMLAGALGRQTLAGASGSGASGSGASVPALVHVPGRADLEPILAVAPELLSLPVADWVAVSAPVLGPWLAAGGRIVWGAVPVDRPLGTTEETLWRRLSGLWCALHREGLDPMLIRTSSLVGPADGLAHFGVSQVERVVELTAALSHRVHQQARAARLTIGA